RPSAAFPLASSERSGFVPSPALRKCSGSGCRSCHGNVVLTPPFRHSSKGGAQCGTNSTGRRCLRLIRRLGKRVVRHCPPDDGRPPTCQSASIFSVPPL